MPIHRKSLVYPQHTNMEGAGSAPRRSNGSRPSQFEGTQVMPWRNITKSERQGGPPESCKKKEAGSPSPVTADGGRVAVDSSKPHPNWMAGFCVEPPGDINTCCLGFWVPCALYGKTHWRLVQVSKGKDSSDDAWALKMGCNTPCWGWYCVNCLLTPILSGIATGIQRAQVRGTYGIEGTVCADITLGIFCTVCTQIHIDREVRAREGNEKLRYSKSWRNLHTTDDGPVTEQPRPVPPMSYLSPQIMPDNPNSDAQIRGSQSGMLRSFPAMPRMLQKLNKKCSGKPAAPVHGKLSEFAPEIELRIQTPVDLSCESRVHSFPAKQHEVDIDIVVHVPQHTHSPAESGSSAIVALSNEDSLSRHPTVVRRGSLGAGKAMADETTFVAPASDAARDVNHKPSPAQKESHKHNFEDCPIDGAAVDYYKKVEQQVKDDEKKVIQHHDLANYPEDIEGPATVKAGPHEGRVTGQILDDCYEAEVVKSSAANATSTSNETREHRLASCASPSVIIPQTIMEDENATSDKDTYSMSAAREHRLASCATPSGFLDGSEMEPAPIDNAKIHRMSSCPTPMVASSGSVKRDLSEQNIQGHRLASCPTPPMLVQDSVTATPRNEATQHRLDSCASPNDIPYLDGAFFSKESSAKESRKETHIPAERKTQGHQQVGYRGAPVVPAHSPIPIPPCTPSSRARPASALSQASPSRTEKDCRLDKAGNEILGVSVGSVSPLNESHHVIPGTNLLKRPASQLHRLSSCGDPFDGHKHAVETRAPQTDGATSAEDVRGIRLVDCAALLAPDEADGSEGPFIAEGHCVPPPVVAHHIAENATTTPDCMREDRRFSYPVQRSEGSGVISSNDGTQSTRQSSDGEEQAFAPRGTLPPFSRNGNSKPSTTGSVLKSAWRSNAEATKCDIAIPRQRRRGKRGAHKVVHMTEDAHHPRLLSS